MQLKICFVVHINVYLNPLFSCKIRACKIPPSVQSQRSYVDNFITHYTCKNTDLNLLLVTAKIKGFIFLITDSSMLQSIDLGRGGGGGAGGYA